MIKSLINNYIKQYGFPTQATLVVSFWGEAWKAVPHFSKSIFC